MSMSAYAIRQYLQSKYRFLGQPIVFENGRFEYHNVSESDYNMYYHQMLRDEKLKNISASRHFDFAHPDFRKPGYVGQKYTIAGHFTE